MKKRSLKKLSYKTYSGGPLGYQVDVGRYQDWAKKPLKGQLYQGASGTWYRDGVRVGKGSGPQRLKNPEAVQRAYNLKVAKDLQSRHRAAEQSKSEKFAIRKTPSKPVLHRRLPKTTITKASVAKALST